MEVYAGEREHSSSIERERERERSIPSSSTSSTSSTSSSTIRVRARARVCVCAYAREQIAQAYYESLGRDIPRYCQEIVEAMLEDGIEAAVICYGLHEAAKAPYPSWRYANAVITRCIRQGIRTAAALSTMEFSTRQKSTVSAGWSQATKKVREQMYTQREYQETDELPAWMQARIQELHPQ